MLLNAQQLALEILSNMCCPDGENVFRVIQKNLYVIIVHIIHCVLVAQFCSSYMSVPKQKCNASALQKESLKSSAVFSGSL